MVSACLDFEETTKFFQSGSAIFVSISSVWVFQFLCILIDVSIVTFLKKVLAILLTV